MNPYNLDSLSLDKRQKIIQTIKVAEELNHDDKRLRKKNHPPIAERIRWICRKRYFKNRNFNNHNFKEKLIKTFINARKVYALEHQKAGGQVMRYIRTTTRGTGIRVPKGTFLRRHPRKNLRYIVDPR